MYILPEFKSRKCSISFSRDYTSQGKKNKKALKIKAFRGYIFFIALIWLRLWDLPPAAFTLYIKSANTAQSLHIVVTEAKHSFASVSPCARTALAKNTTPWCFFAALPNELRSSDNPKVVEWFKYTPHNAKRTPNGVLCVVKGL